MAEPKMLTAKDLATKADISPADSAELQSAVSQPLKGGVASVKTGRRG